ncbi:MAG TPA: methyltransferase domain-containing protein, partial [Candidatus Hydrogenedentes bacterium]|nr:methyltransferase domain-containing protein [Candidatus Hydrogenedentota bacterium]
MTEWFENESFWREMYAHMFPDERFEKAQEEIEGVYGLVGFEGKTALDLCCGPGRHAIAMAKRGVKVTAVDRTRFLLDKARERAQAAQVDVEWVLSDMREFARPVAFDLAISMFTSFGYFEDRQDNLRVLRNVYQSLRPGGAC